MLQKIKERIFAGGEITPDEALELAQKAIRSDLYTAADEIRKKFCNKTLDTCSIINARSGHCPENCKWCAQSAHHHTQIETYDAIPIHEAISIARLNEQQGIKRLSLVTSGRRIKASEIDYFCDIYRKMGEETHLHLCASMGLLKREELEKLKAAGVKRYHCNLETASSYFSELCTTHTIEQKKETIRTAQKLGMEICSGGIIGMGENMKQRIELAFENHTYWDLRRWRIADKEMESKRYTGLSPYFDLRDNTYIFKVVDANDQRYTFDVKMYYERIPDSEIAKNQKLIQNPYYN